MAPGARFGAASSPAAGVRHDEGRVGRARDRRLAGSREPRADLASALKAGGLSREEFREAPRLGGAEAIPRNRPTHPWAWEDREERAAAIEKIVQDPVKAGFLRAFAACGQITQACVSLGSHRECCGG